MSAPPKTLENTGQTGIFPKNSAKAYWEPLNQRQSQNPATPRGGPPKRKPRKGKEREKAKDEKKTTKKSTTKKNDNLFFSLS